MKLGKFGTLLVVLAMFWPLASVSAKEAPDVKADTQEQFSAVAEHVREQMGAGGRFQFVTAGERDTVTRDLGGMQSLFDRFAKVDAMDQASKIQLYNYQSEINAILTRRDGDREICSEDRPTGSHIPRTTCRKYADLERERRDTLNMKDQMLHTMLPSDKVSH
jgi:hypothetical protein